MTDDKEYDKAYNVTVLESIISHLKSDKNASHISHFKSIRQ